MSSENIDHDDSEPELTPFEFADQLGESPEEVFKWLSLGMPRRRGAGGVVSIDADEAIEWLEDEGLIDSSCD